jgi:hypothetical protein
LIWLAAAAGFASLLDAAGGVSAALLQEASSNPAAAIANLKELAVSIFSFLPFGERATP